jgi:hypothetical protein
MILAGFKGVNVTESAGRSRGRFGPKGGSASVNPFRARVHTALRLCPANQLILD